MSETVKKKTFLLFCTVGILSSFVLVGCGQEPGSGKPRGTITISITYGDEPVTEGTVSLEDPVTAEGGGGELNDKGTATIQGVVLGDYTVTVVPPDPDPIPPEPGQPAPKMKNFLNIPQKFRIAKTSPLKAEVKEGTNEFQFELKE